MQPEGFAVRSGSRHRSIFRSKIDVGLLVILAAGLAWPWVSLARRFWAGRPLDALDLVAVTLVSGIVVWLLGATYYVVTDESVIVRAGPYRKTVPLGTISRLRATRSVRRAPALSLDRIEIRYGSKRLIVSPRDKAGFVRAIAERAPAADVADPSLARGGTG